MLCESGQEDRMPVYEIEVTDYFKIIWRRKWLIFFGTVLVVGIATIASIALPKTYEAVGYLRIGKIAGRFIDTPVAVRAQIMGTPYVEMYIQNNGLDLSKSDFKMRVDAGARIEIIRITVNGPSREILANFLRYVIEDTVASHTKTYDELQGLKNQRVQELEKQIAYLEERIAEMQEILGKEDSGGAKRQTGSLVLMSAVVGMEAQLSQLKDRYTDFMLRIATMENEESRFLHIDASDNPIRPNLKLNVLIGLFLGFMIFVAVSLFLEYNKIKDQEKQI